jgi:hypothetical protein
MKHLSINNVIISYSYKNKLKKGENMIKTYVLTDTALELTLPNQHSYFHFRNDGNSTAYVGYSADILPDSDNILSIPSGTAAFLSKGINEKIYAIGGGNLLVYGTFSDTSPFKTGGEGGDGGTSDHSKLTNLDYANSGHTGFATAEQGEKADNALQSADIGVTVQPYNSNTVVDGNYSAVKENVSTNTENIATNTADIATVNLKIPAQATAENQLGDKNFINSTVNSLSADFITYNAIGDPFPTFADLQSATVFYNDGKEITPAKSDYCVVLADENHDNAQCRYVYSGSQWNFQYKVNDTPFTSAQNAAINSGITENAVAQIGTNTTNIAKKYEKPSTGIPKSDLTSAVQTSLEKADNAIQEHTPTITFYVNFLRSTAVDDDTAGSAAKPFKTISYALNYCKRKGIVGANISCQYNNFSSTDTINYTISSSDLQGFYGAIYGGNNNTTQNTITFTDTIIDVSGRCSLFMNYCNFTGDITLRQFVSLSIRNSTFLGGTLEIENCYVSMFYNTLYAKPATETTPAGDYNVILDLGAVLCESSNRYNNAAVCAINNANGLYFRNNAQTGTSALGITNPENSIGYYSLQKKQKDALANSTTFEQFKQAMA